jgi:aminoglycoside phosphotransferase
MNPNNELKASELMDIIASQLRSLHEMDLNDRNIGKCIAKSKEVANLAGKAITLSYYELERQKMSVGDKLLPEPTK